jgi:hypothetical protein
MNITGKLIGYPNVTVMGHRSGCGLMGHFTDLEKIQKELFPSGVMKGKSLHLVKNEDFALLHLLLIEDDDNG